MWHKLANNVGLRSNQTTKLYYELKRLKATHYLFEYKEDDKKKLTVEVLLHPF